MAACRCCALLAALLLLTALACAPSSHAAIPGVQQKTLVLISDEALASTHSKYLSSLQALGAELDLKLSSDASLQLRDWDSWRYGNVVIMDPSATGAHSCQSTCGFLRSCIAVYVKNATTKRHEEAQHWVVACRVWRCHRCRCPAGVR